MDIERRIESYPQSRALTPVLLVVLLLARTAIADIINVPGDFSTIQAAINNAETGVDEVVVAPGTYFEHINFLGKAITLRSSDGVDVTTIDGTGLASSVAKCVSGEGLDSVLDGFTITGGAGSTCFGGGIFCGGGMYNATSSPTVTNCTFSGNTAAIRGGGMNTHRSSPMLTNCTFSGNSANEVGGGMQFSWSSPTVTHCTFSGNDAANGGALAFISSNQQFPSDLSMSNCILWDGGGEIWNDDKSMISIAYSNVQGGWAGEGNIDLDPLIVEAGYRDDNGTPEDSDDDFWVEGDYHLLPGSPSIDAADNTAVPDGIETDLDGNPRFVNDLDTQDTGVSEGGCPTIDMGAYEYQDGTEQCCPADFNGNGTVGASDLAELLGSWGPYEPCPPFDAADFDEDCGVNAADLAQLLRAWGPCP